MSLYERLLRQSLQKPMHFSLLDPDKQKPEVAGEIADLVADMGSSAMMVGGSTLSSQRQVDETVDAIKESCSLPVILFPSGARFLSSRADAVFFMSLLNSRNLDFVIREHVKGAGFVKQSGLEPISMGYVIVEPGMTVGRVGEADLVGASDVKTAVGYALAAQYLGMQLVYLEAGSGASFPVSNEMIAGVRREIDIPLVIGGGITSAEVARDKVAAGANIIVTGTTLEKEKQMKGTLKQIINAVEG